MRFALGVEYDGARFHGWQMQEDVPTVQACVEDALSRVADHPVAVQCAGRTDAGVHATGQVVHFDTSAVRDARAWVLGGNVNLPDDVSISWARPVPERFHARYSAIARSYRYVILNRTARSALLGRRAVWVHRPLDADRMHDAAQALVGEHDFSSYRALGCQAKSPLRTVTRLEVRRGGELVIMDISANAFLHHMVRNIAGVLIAIGRGDRRAGWAQDVLERRDRTRGGVTAPAAGLYLVQVDYPEGFAIPRASLPGLGSPGQYA
ncbi:MAG: tRNA pseudouridine(38-40) synthase TruA [Chromatiales bacterium]|jgi:tRNA pseudouridine38-40 synthase